MAGGEEESILKVMSNLPELLQQQDHPSFQNTVAFQEPFLRVVAPCSKSAIDELKLPENEEIPHRLAMLQIKNMRITEFTMHARPIHSCPTKQDKVPHDPNLSHYTTFPRTLSNVHA